MRLETGHYASGFVARVAIVGAVVASCASYFYLPAELLTSVMAIVKNLWVALGPLAAFGIQLALQLVNVGEDKLLSESQQRSLSKLVNQRLRFIWDLTALILLTLVLCLSASSLDANAVSGRVLVSIAIGLLSMTAILAARFPTLFRDIKDFRWRMAGERRAIEERAIAQRQMRDDRALSLPDIPEPERRNGTH